MAGVSATDLSGAWEAYDADREIAAACTDPRVQAKREFVAGFQAAALLARDFGVSPQQLLAQVAAFGSTVGTAVEHAAVPQGLRHFRSPVFGPIRDASPHEAAALAALVEQCPAAVFGALNKRMNGRGFCISTDSLDGAERTSA